MPKNYIVDLTDGITTVRFIKQPRMEDIYSAVNDVAEKYMSDLRLWDFSHEGVNLSDNQLTEIASYGKTKFLKPSKVAFVAPKDLAYGLSKVYEVKAYRGDGSIEFMVFRTEKEACSWLKG